MSTDSGRAIGTQGFDIHLKGPVMTVQYVVSISGELLYFDAEHQPAPEFPHDADDTDRKPALKLIPVEQKPAARPEWNDALSRFTPEQRSSAEISEVIGD